MENKIVCPICGKIQKNNNQLSIHLSFHKDKETYPNGVFCPKCNHHSKSFKGFCRHVTMFHKSEIEQVYRMFFNDKKDHFCEYCKINKTTVLKIQHGFEKYCCLDCANTAHKINHKIAMENLDTSKLDYASRVVKRQQTCIEIYGVDNAAKSEIVKEKTRKTFQERYGSDNPMGNKDVQELTKSRNRETYGCDWHLSSPDVINKRKQNLIKKYGVDNVRKIPEVKKKIAESTFKSNGVNNGFLCEKAMKSKSNYFLKEFNKNKTKYAIPLFSEEEWHNRKQNSMFLFECKVCHKQFKFNALSHLKPRCFDCMPPIEKYRSKGEQEVFDFISTLKVDVKKSDRKTLKGKELDILCKDYNLAIEHNGIYWHSEANGIENDYHIYKTEKCNEAGIKLLHIFETEWKNKKDIVKSIISSNLNKFEKIIHGRKCVAKRIDSKTANNFYEENHIQGKTILSISFGLYYNDELVSCLSFSKPRFNKKYDWELVRYANKLNTKIHGGFGKLWKHKPEGKIICYSDKRLFSGNVYKKYMNQLEDSGPSYFYIVDGELKNRINFQKHKLKDLLPVFDEKLTEVENMKANGFYRIWDCGNFVFEFV